MPAPWFSPDGRYTVDVNPIEMRMSHWVDRPFIIDEHTHTLILDLAEGLWSVDRACWSEDSASVSLDLRRYPGTIPGVQVDVHIPTRTVTLHTPEEVRKFPISLLLKRLETFARSQPGLAKDWY